MPRSFEEVVLPHLDAAFNYARWLTKNDADAEDVVQDASVRALRFFSSLQGEDARAWLLTIVRNTWYGRFPRRAGGAVTAVAEEDAANQADVSLDPEAQAIQQQTVELVAPRIHSRQRLPATLIAKLGRLRPDHLAHHLPRHPKLAANHLDRLVLGEIRPTDLRNRLHYQHP